MMLCGFGVRATHSVPVSQSGIRLREGGRREGGRERWPVVEWISVEINRLE
jgi:hypothetical protein